MTFHAKKLLISGLALAGMLLALAGCNQGEDPAEAMLKDFSGRSPGGSAPANSNPEGDTGITKGAAGEDLLNAGGDLLADGAANPCGGDAEEEYTGPHVTVSIEDVDNGYPEYTGKGKYDIRLEVQSDEVPATTSIWHIIAYDDNDEKVGETQQHLKIPSAYAKIIALNGLYCTNMPTRFEFRRMEGDAMTMDDALAQQGGSGDSGVGRSAGGGGGSAPPSRGASGDEDDGDGGDDGMGDE